MDPTGWTLENKAGDLPLLDWPPTGFRARVLLGLNHIAMRGESVVSALRFVFPRPSACGSGESSRQNRPLRCCTRTGQSDPGRRLKGGACEVPRQRRLPGLCHWKRRGQNTCFWMAYMVGNGGLRLISVSAPRCCTCTSLATRGGGVKVDQAAPPPTVLCRPPVCTSTMGSHLDGLPS